MNAARMLAVALAGALATGCGRQPEKAADGAAAATAEPIKTVTFTPEQIGHAGIQWAAAESALMAAQVDVPARVIADAPSRRRWRTSSRRATRLSAKFTAM